MAIISFDHHVHYYQQFSLDTLFDSAYQNLTTASELHTGETNNSIAVICLLECEESEHFRKLRSGEYTLENWHLRAQLGEKLLEFGSSAGHVLRVVTGQQIASEDKLEVLVLGNTLGEIQLPLDKILAQHIDTNTMLLPWAVGKWLGKRGQMVTELLEQHKETLLVGDNSGRPDIWKSIPQFEAAAELGLAILPGSDPLPLPNQEQIVGRNGVLLEGELDNDNDVLIMLNKLKRNSVLATFTQLESVAGFLINQISLRLPRRS